MKVELSPSVEVEWENKAFGAEVYITTADAGIRLWLLDETDGEPTVFGHIITNDGSGSLGFEDEEKGGMEQLVEYLKLWGEQDRVDYLGGNPELAAFWQEWVFKTADSMVVPAQPFDYEGGESVRAMVQLYQVTTDEQDQAIIADEIRKQLEKDQPRLIRAHIPQDLQHLAEGFYQEE